MPVRVHVEPSLIQWASQRSGKPLEDLGARFPRVGAWVRGEAEPTLKQLEAFAKATSTPIGFLMLPEAPDLPLPVPDFRTLAGGDRRPPSADLLDTIYLCEERQEWYRRYTLAQGEDPLDFVGSVNLGDDVTATAAWMRDRLKFDLEHRLECGSWTEALGKLSERAEDVGVLVMISGVVGSNTRRVLDPDEFRGFALVDDRAPVVFVNGTDTKAAQIFTLAHELAHVWLGQSALSNPRHDIRRDDQQVERFCNTVAAELLVPASHLQASSTPPRRFTTSSSGSQGCTGSAPLSSCGRFMSWADSRGMRIAPRMRISSRVSRPRLGRAAGISITRSPSLRASASLTL